MSERFCLCDSPSRFGNYCERTLWKAILWWITSQTARWLISGWCATSSTVICLFCRIMSRTRSMFSSVMDLDRRPTPSSSLTLVQPFLNTPLFDTPLQNSSYHGALTFFYVSRHPADPQPVRNGSLLVLLSCSAQRDDHISVRNLQQSCTIEIKTARHF